MAESAASPAVTPEELELLAHTLRKTMTTTAPGAALGAALAGLGWQEMLAAMPTVAVPLVFRLLGETGAHAPVLNDVIGAALGDQVPDAGTAPVLPYAGGAWVVWERGDEATSALELPLRQVAPAGSSPRPAQPSPRPAQPSPRPAQPSPGTGQPSPLPFHPAPLTPQALAAGRVAAGWWLLGSGRAMLALARQHALDRVQFGRPLASFQAVRHKLAETLVALDGAEAALRAASADDEHGYPPATALLAKAAAGQAALLAARHCQQVLGGIGFTAEHALHHHVKRVLVLDGLLGSARELAREAGRGIIADGRAPRLVDL